MGEHKYRFLFILSPCALALMITASAVGQAHVTVPGHTLCSLQGVTDPNAMNEDWQTPLMAAAFDGDEEAVKNLIIRKANINVGDQSGRTALMYARGIGVVEILLDAGAFVNDKDIKGTTALQWATAVSDADVVQALIKAGANVNARDDKGMSALHLAKLELSGEGFADQRLRDEYRRFRREGHSGVLSRGN